MSLAAPGRLPTGTVTFLRTDVEGSMRLARALGPDWDTVNATHLGLLRDAVERHRGVVVRTEGDAMFASFQEAGAGLLAAIEAQRALEAEAWPPGAAVRVRMGIHTGEAHLAGDDYGGFEVNRAARIAAVGHGGQIVVSATTGSLVDSNLPAGVRLRDLGRHALRDIPMPEQLFQVDVPGLPQAFPALRLVQATDGNLPDRLTTFVGRAAELTELGVLLADHRLVTLTGPGGIGKTSLAIELARSRTTGLRDGAWLVPLDDVIDPGMVTSAVARTLGLFDGVDRPAAEALPAFLADRSLLLVLDNFEHLLDAAGQVVALLRASPSSRIVVTSRAPLHVGGEQEYPVRPLVVGRGEADADEPSLDAATRLFVDRARAVRPDWDPAPDLPVVREICVLLDGLPLGIELAAARLSLLPPAAIRDRLAARLPLPGAGPRDAPARQRTLEGAIDWSHDLLSPLEQATLHALAVFEGSFDVTQAEPVISDFDAATGDALERLLALGEHSLIARDQAPMGDAGRLAGSGIRFGMLRTVQAYAARRLEADGREADVRRRHALAYLELAETGAQHLFAAAQPPWIDRLTLDQPNLRAALRWAIDSGEADLALRLVAASWRFWQITGRLAEGKEWAETALSMPGADEPTSSRVWALAAAGGIAYWRSERERSRLHYREQLSIAERLGDPVATADAFFNLASTSWVQGDHEESERHLDEARRLYLELGDDRGVNRVDLSIAMLLMDARGPDAMVEALGPILERAAALDDAPYVVVAGGTLAWGNFMLGNVNGAAHLAIGALLASYGMRDVAGATIGLPAAALVAIDAGLTEEGALVMGAFEGLCERYGVRPPVGLADLIRETDPGVRLQGLLGPAAYAEAFERGQRMTIDEAMDLVVRIGDAVPAGDQPELMDRDDPAWRGQRDYSRPVLRLYDPFVLGFAARFVWRCPTSRLVDGYREHIRDRHLDVGPGTGYFVDKSALPVGSRVTLLDPNPNVLDHAARRLRRLDVTTVEADVLKPLPVDPPFDSAALHLVFHCLPGPLTRKAAAIEHIAAVLAPTGVLFGASVLGTAGSHTWLARRYLAAFNRQGGFDNLDDTEDGLRGILAASFEHVELEVVGSIAIFSATGPRSLHGGSIVPPQPGPIVGVSGTNPPPATDDRRRI